MSFTVQFSGYMSVSDAITPPPVLSRRYSALLGVRKEHSAQQGSVLNELSWPTHTTNVTCFSLSVCI